MSILASLANRRVSACQQSLYVQDQSIAIDLLQLGEPPAVLHSLNVGGVDSLKRLAQGPPHTVANSIFQTGSFS